MFVMIANEFQFTSRYQKMKIIYGNDFWDVTINPGTSLETYADLIQVMTFVWINHRNSVVRL